MARKLTTASLACLVVLYATAALRAEPGAKAVPAQQPMDVLNATLARWAEVVQPPEGQPARAFVTRVKITRAKGLPNALAGLAADVAFQAPDRLRVSADVNGRAYSVGRDRQSLWASIPHKEFALVGKSGVPRFQTHPDELDATVLPPFASPIEPGAIGVMLALKSRVSLLPAQAGDPAGTQVLRITCNDGCDVDARLWVRESDRLPLKFSYRDGGKTDVEVVFDNPRFETAWPDDKWVVPADGATAQATQTVALAHLVRFL